MLTEPRHGKTCFSHMWTTKVQFSLRSLISAFIVFLIGIRCETGNVTPCHDWADNTLTLNGIKWHHSLISAISEALWYIYCFRKKVRLSLVDNQLQLQHVQDAIFGDSYMRCLRDSPFADLQLNNSRPVFYAGWYVPQGRADPPSIPRYGEMAAQRSVSPHRREWYFLPDQSIWLGPPDGQHCLQHSGGKGSGRRDSAERNRETVGSTHCYRVRLSKYNEQLPLWEIWARLRPILPPRGF